MVSLAVQDAPLGGAATSRATRLLLAGAFVVFASPAVADLAQTSWQTEAGSLAPLVVTLGGFALWREISVSRGLSRPGSAAIWVPVLAVASLVLIFASAITMASLSALAVWAGGVALLYAVYGLPVLRRCAFPLGFLAMVIPLPYSLSMAANAALRSFVAEQAVALGTLVGVDAALEQGTIIAGPYVLAVENACSGANSTLSLVSISVLYAYWIHNHSALRAWFAGALAIPIAMSANVGRVVALMALVEWQGSSVLSTILHPLSGLVSFTFAVALLLLFDRIAVAFSGRVRS